MKKLILPVALLLSATMLRAQSTEVLQEPALFKTDNVNITAFEMGGGYVRTSIANTAMNGGSINFGVVLNHRYKTGFIGDFSATHELNFPTEVAVINPKFRYNQFSWDNELLLLSDKLIHFSAQLKTGMGLAEYDDDYYQKHFYTGKVAGYEPKTLKYDYMFAVEPGLNMFVNIVKHVRFYIGGSYRMVAGAGALENSNSYNAFTFSTGVSFNADPKTMKK